MPAPPSWLTFLHLFSDCFNSPSRRLFEQLVTAWALCPGRRTLTRLWSVIPAAPRRRYGAYARWVREGDWSMHELWRCLVVHLVQHWLPSGCLTLLLDDTLVNKCGRKVEGAGFFRDAVMSSVAAHKVTAWGLNVVILALRVPSPWGGEPLALPVMACLHRRGEQELSHVELAASMIRQLAEWLPDHHFRLITDGAYASLVRHQLPRTVVITRLRRNAALYELPPPRTGRRGRPRTKGERLPTPPELAARVSNWTPTQLCLRGQTVERLLWARQLLWYEMAGSRPLLLVIVRYPAGRQPDDFFLCTDSSIAPPQVVSDYADRWAIEDTNRNLKQYLGVQNPQSWVKFGPERIVSLAGWLYAAVWHWYLSVHADRPTWPDRPWYTTKRDPSFADALAALRRETWTAIFDSSAPGPLSSENPAALITVLADAA